MDEALHKFSDTNSIVEHIHRCVGWPFSCVCIHYLKHFGKVLFSSLGVKLFSGKSYWEVNSKEQFVTAFAHSTGLFYPAGRTNFKHWCSSYHFSSLHTELSVPFWRCWGTLLQLHSLQFVWRRSQQSSNVHKHISLNRVIIGHWLIALWSDMTVYQKIW